MGDVLNEDQLKTHIKRLEQQLLHERTARKKAEDMLRVKTSELYSTKDFVSSMTERLQLAIASAEEIVWEYVIAENNFYQYEGFEEGRGKIDLAASYADVVSAYHYDDQATAEKHWQNLKENKTDSFEFLARRYAPEHKSFRWNLVRGKKLFDKKTGKAVSVLGMFRDVHETQIADLAYLAIKNTFKFTQIPGILCDFSNDYTIVSNTCSELLGYEPSQITQAAIANAIPLQAIKENLLNGNKQFVFNLDTSGQETSFIFRFSPLVQPTLSDGSLQYAVGFILPHTD